MIEKKLHDLLKQEKDLGDRMNGGGLSGDEFAKAVKEFAKIGKVTPIIREYMDAKKAITDAEEMLSNPELKEMADAQAAEFRRKLPEIEEKLQIALLPKDDADDKSAIVEIRAGVGGDEAALFAGDLYNQYLGLAARHDWKVEIIGENPISLHGYKEIIFKIQGVGVYERLKFEGGIHRVQRVPETEASGRIHTSAASVAVMPEAEDLDVLINESDLRVDVYRSSGAGGQSVNRTESAVRITHIPTGIVVTCQNERSQIQNRATAMSILRSKIYEKQRLAQQNERDDLRGSMVGGGDRSEKIRTYNFPEQRVTDHRIKLTLYKLADILAGGAALDEMIDALIASDQLARLSTINS
ncbi:MAG: peptide chain release factor 1 [Rickettsiales bacterium]|jgi:peptide chain release factor 1|nr:peptide chain release factor 1 [Rickettsiales bacterium]